MNRVFHLGQLRALETQTLWVSRALKKVTIGRVLVKAFLGSMGEEVETWNVHSCPFPLSQSSRVWS
jgi:hypothetical protein